MKKIQSNIHLRKRDKMEGTLVVKESELHSLKRAANINSLKIRFTEYKRLQPQTPLGYSDAEVYYQFELASDIFTLGRCFEKERTSEISFGKITIDFP